MSDRVIQTGGPRPIRSGGGPRPIRSGGGPRPIRAEIQQAIGAELAASIQRLTRAEPQIRGGTDPEAVHQARVATRRIRSTLRVFRPFLDGQWSDELRGRLSGLADVLGRQRDADVMVERLDEAIRSLGQRDAKAATLLRDKLEAQREIARAHLLTSLEGPDYEDLVDALGEAAARPRFSVADPGEIGNVLEPAITAWAKLRDAVSSLGALPSTEDLHRVRLLTKRARYAAETLIPVAGQGAERFAERASRLQEVLGRLQDATIAHTWLRSAGVRSTPRVAFAAGCLAATLSAAADDARRTWHREWERLDRKKNTDWMGESQ